MRAANRIVALVLAWMTAAALGQTPVPPLPPAPTPAGNATIYGPAPAPLLPPGSGATLGSPMPPAPGTYAPPGPAAYAAPAPPTYVSPSQTPYPSPPPATYATPPPPTTPAPLFAPAQPASDGQGLFGFPAVLPTLFFGADLYFLQPSIKGTLSGNMPQPGGSTFTFTTPGANLDFAVSPQIKVGWRVPDNNGEFSFDYRFLATSGSGPAADSSGPLSTRTRLNMNIFDFDYASIRYAPWPRYFVQYRFGIRLETVYFDNQASDGNGFFESASNYFVGAGPHAAVEFGREINLVPGLAVFGNLDAAAAFGRDQQHFSETLSDGTFMPFGQARTQSAANLTAQAGLSYTPPRLEHLRFFAGFQYERFWKVGGSDGDVQDYGGFLGGAFDY